MNLLFREALEKDIPALVALLADDELGQQREDVSKPLNKVYLQMFDNISKDPNNVLIVAEENQTIVGMLQLTFIPYLTHIGSWRCLIEGVRISRQYRNKGIGNKLFDWAIERAKIKKCKIVQLTSDKQRPNAIRFYQRLGFEASHEGLKLKLTN